ncbi:MAG: hypothetical protein IPL61_32120 [Myxococcales bacterium]|nr:hypothetical protein [Myxococcales bacterium]
MVRLATCARAAVLGLLIGAALGGCRGRRRPPPDAPLAVDAPPPVVLTPALIARLASLAVPGHDVRVLARGERDVALAVSAGDVRATVTVASCLACVAIDVAAWQADRAALAALWAPAAEAGPAASGAALTLAALALADTTAITIDARRGAGAGATYTGYWNDGATQVLATCEVPALAAGATSPCAPVVATALAAAVAALR